jgi:hypothetical protein
VAVDPRLSLLQMKVVLLILCLNKGLNWKERNVPSRVTAEVSVEPQDSVGRILG